MFHCSTLKAIVAVIGLAAASTVAQAAPVLLYANNFDAPAFVNPMVTSGGFGPIGLAPWVGPAGLGPVGNQFSGNVGALPVATGSATTTLTLNGLSAHSTISIDFLAIMVNSWDGIGGSPGPDRFRLAVNGITIFDEIFATASGSSSYAPTAGVALGCSGGAVNYVGATFLFDCAFNFAASPIFDSIAHSASTLTIDWTAYGPGWQGGGVFGDEALALDNINIYLDGLVAAPAPGALALVGAGLFAFGATRRRRRRRR